jgi:hypothetical protein
VLLYAVAQRLQTHLHATTYWQVASYNEDDSQPSITTQRSHTSTPRNATHTQHNAHTPQHTHTHTHAHTQHLLPDVTATRGTLPWAQRVATTAPGGHSSCHPTLFTGRTRCQSTPQDLFNLLATPHVNLRHTPFQARLCPPL